MKTDIKPHVKIKWERIRNNPHSFLPEIEKFIPLETYLHQMHDAAQRQKHEDSNFRMPYHRVDDKLYYVHNGQVFELNENQNATAPKTTKQKEIAQ